MMILAFEVETPGLTAAAFAPYLDAEAARVWELYQAGVIREMYFRSDRRYKKCCLRSGRYDGSLRDYYF